MTQAEKNKLDSKTLKALEQEKKVLNNTKKVDSIINVDLDNKSLMTELMKITIKDNVKENVQMFRFETLIKGFNSLDKEEQKKKAKQIRKKARKLRTMYCNQLCNSFKNKETKELKQTIKSFNSFYKEYYVLNDYSIKSLCRNSSDNETLILVTLALQVVKNNK